MLRHILVAVDFSDASERALQAAGALARRWGARVTALHAETFEAPPYFTRDQIRQLEDERDRMQAAGAAHLRELGARAGVPEIAPVVVDGSATEAILAREGEVDLIVMGTHGRRGLGRWWLGSVTERVLRETRVPLLVVRPEPHAAAGDDLFQRVLVLDAAAGHRAERWAGELAARFGGGLTRVPLPGAAGHDPVPGACTKEHLASASLVVVAIETQGDARLAAAAVRLLRDCSRPMLFVP